MKPETSFNVKKMVVEMAGARSAQAKEDMSHDRAHIEIQIIMILEMLMHEGHKHAISSTLAPRIQGLIDTECFAVRSDGTEYDRLGPLRAEGNAQSAQASHGLASSSRSNMAMTSKSLRVRSAQRSEGNSWRWREASSFAESTSARCTARRWFVRWPRHGAAPDSHFLSRQ